jgi:hypothetical protein
MLKSGRGDSGRLDSMFVAAKAEGPLVVEPTTGTVMPDGNVIVCTAGLLVAVGSVEAEATIPGGEVAVCTAAVVDAAVGLWEFQKGLDRAGLLILTVKFHPLLSSLDDSVGPCVSESLAIAGSGCNPQSISGSSWYAISGSLPQYSPLASKSSPPPPELPAMLDKSAPPKEAKFIAFMLCVCSRESCQNKKSFGVLSRVESWSICLYAAASSCFSLFMCARVRYVPKGTTFGALKTRPHSIETCSSSVVLFASHHGLSTIRNLCETSSVVHILHGEQRLI